MNQFKDELSLNTVFRHYNVVLKKFIQFLNKKHAQPHSLLNLNIEKAEKEWIWWLDNNGVKTSTSSKNRKNDVEYKFKSSQANFLRNMYEKLLYLTDTREGLEKD
nr:hypothetical protein [Bacillus cereus]